MTQGSASPPRIRLLREIASGPLSVTFVAERRVGAEVGLVSVKVLRQRTKGDVDRLLKLRDTSRQLAALGHPRIVCVEDVARVGDLVALVTPYVDGIDLLDLVEVLRARSIVLPTRARCEIVLGIAEALEVAQDEVPPGRDAPLGRVHRDLRPSNVMIDRSGDLYVLDFGTGFTTLAGRAARAGALKKGIIKYMSPGRREGKRGGSTADVYSLGILATELFRGRWLRRLQSHNPAHDRYLAEVVARLVNLGLGSEQDELALRNILLRMIAFDPDARPTAHEVAVTFQGLAARARGADLHHFVAKRADLWAEALDHAPDADLAGAPVHVLETGATWDDVPFYDEGEIPDKLRLKAERDELVWEETPHGWKETGDHADTLEAFFDQDTLDEESLPGAPPISPDEEETEPGGFLPEDLLRTAEMKVSEPAAAAEAADAAVPEVATPDAAAPEVATPDAAAPEVATPDAAAPEVATPDAAAPEVATPDAATPDAAAPEVAPSDVVAPDAAAPEVAPPDVATPDAAAPEVAPPEVAAPEIALAAQGAAPAPPAPAPPELAASDVDPTDTTTDPTLVVPRAAQPPPDAVPVDTKATTQQAVPVAAATPVTPATAPAAKPPRTSPAPARRVIPWVLIIGGGLLVIAVFGGLAVGLAIAWFG